MPPKPPRLDRSAPCPCGHAATLGDCCLRFIEGRERPATAEVLMRSRYTAHVISAIDYLWDTWHPAERLRSSKADIRAWAESCEWLGLNILRNEQGGPHDDQGIVEFVASFRHRGQMHQHHETSVFKKQDGIWLYVDHQA